MPTERAVLPPVPPLAVESTRGGILESRHTVAVAAADQPGRLVAWAGDPEQITFWRSAAKPFQAMPLVQDGAADAFGFGEPELALACASHSSEPQHVELARRMLAAIGCSERDLACGGHTPLGDAAAKRMIREGLTPTPVWSNCSGKHAGMLALARHHGWPTAGYEKREHPVQQRIIAETAGWTGVDPADMGLGIDGCTVVCFGLPLHAMARAYARLITATEPAAVRIRQAMMRHPELVAGAGRYCTHLMSAWPGGVLAKVGAEGVYSAALPDAGVGITLKVEDGDMVSAPIALHGVLEQLVARLLPERAGDSPLARVAAHGGRPIRHTRGEITGELRLSGDLRFAVPSPKESMSGTTSRGVS
jgi:L-asparaginase II